MCILIVEAIGSRFYVIKNMKAQRINYCLSRNNTKAYQTQYLKLLHHASVRSPMFGCLSCVKAQALCCVELWHLVINTIVVFITRCHNSTKRNRSFQTSAVLPTLCLKKSGNFAKCLTYTLPSTIGLSRHRMSQLGRGPFPVFV